MNLLKAIRVSLFLIAPFMCVLPAKASQELQTPEEVTRLYMQARHSADWKAAVAYVDEDHIRQLHPIALKGFEDDGSKGNIFRKYFLDAEINSTEVSTLPQRALVGSYLNLLNLTRSSRQGLTEYLSFKLLNTYLETPDLANIVVRESARYMETDFQTTSVVRLKKTGQRWYILIDEEVFQTQVAAAQALRMQKSSHHKTMSIDFRNMSEEQGIAAFTAAVKRLMTDRFIKYELIVGNDSHLHSELRQMAMVFNIQYRIDFVNNPAVKPDKQ